MFVMSVDTFMGFTTTLPDHQEMLRRGDLYEHNASMGTDRTMFISHQWTSHAHPDESGTQLKTLQKVFKRLRSGAIGQVEGDWRYQVSVVLHVHGGGVSLKGPTVVCRDRAVLWSCAELCAYMCVYISY